jgi:hypothetical protein
MKTRSENWVLEGPYMKTTRNRTITESQLLERFRAAADRRQDGRIVYSDNAGRSQRRTVRHVGHKQVQGMIWVNSAKRVLAQADRQPRALERPRLARIARQRPAAPHVARALAVRDEHAQGRYGIEHRERVALRLVDRVFLLLRTRVDREARLGRRGRVAVLVHWVVQRRPYEHLQLREVLLDDAQYTLVLPRGLTSQVARIMSEIKSEITEGNTYIIYVFVDSETGQIRRFFRERPEDPRGRQVLPTNRRSLSRKRQALEIQTHTPQRARRNKLLLRRNEAHIKPHRHRLRLLPSLKALQNIRRDAQVLAAHERPVRLGRAKPHTTARVPVMLERNELRLRREPAREGLSPREHAIEALEPERTVVQYPHVVAVHGPLALARLGYVDRRGDRQVFQVHEHLHHPRYYLRIARLRLPVHRAGVGQTLHAAGEIGPREHRAAEEEKSLLGDGDVFVELVLHVGPERTGYETEAVVEVAGVDELQYGTEELNG